MIAVIGFRVASYLRTYHAVAPTIAGLVALGVLYGGGVARAEEAYGVSAVVLFPVLAWQAKILLDVEPDVQRRLVRVGLGSADGEIAGGLLAAALTALPTVLLALALPWLFGGVVTDAGSGLAAALLFGAWAHLIVVPAAVTVGAWASRPVARSAGTSVSVLVAAAVLGIVLGLHGSPAPWLAPPLLALARLGAEGGVGGTGLVRVTAWALAWSAVALFGYWRLRRARP